MTDLDLTDDTIDVRDIIARIEELADDESEHARLAKIMQELATVGGGDVEYNGDWYPITLIAESYFTDYARALLEDCGDLPRDLPHYIEIDWEATARNIRVDYTPVTIDGATYWARPIGRANVTYPHREQDNA